MFLWIKRFVWCDDRYKCVCDKAIDDINRGFDSGIIITDLLLICYVLDVGLNVVDTLRLYSFLRRKFIDRE